MSAATPSVRMNVPVTTALPSTRMDTTARKVAASSRLRRPPVTFRRQTIPTCTRRRRTAFGTSRRRPGIGFGSFSMFLRSNRIKSVLTTTLRCLTATRSKATAWAASAARNFRIPSRRRPTRCSCSSILTRPCIAKDSSPLTRRFAVDICKRRIN